MRRAILVHVDVDSELELGGVVDNLIGDLGHLDAVASKLEPEEIIGDFPIMVSRFLVYELGEHKFALDFGQVIGLMEYVAEKPLVVCQTYLKLSAALNNLYVEYFQILNKVEEEFKKLEAEKYQYYADEENGLQFKRTKDAIMSFVQSDPDWRVKRRALDDAKHVKSRLYIAKDHVEKCYDLARDFVKNGRDVYVGANPKDHTFRQMVDGITKSTVEIEVENDSHRD